MRKTKVAFLADNLVEDYDGAIRTMYQIIQRIPSDRFQYLFLTGEGPRGDIGHPIILTPTLPTFINKNYRLAATFMSESTWIRHLDRFEPDIIHIATPSPLGNFGLKYARQRGIPVISIYHTHFISYVDYYLDKATFLVKPIKSLMMSMMQRFYNACDLVYVPSLSIKEELISIGIFSDQLKIWKRGLNLQTFSPQKRNLKYVRQYSGNDKPNLLFVSRLVWEKNLKTLIEIYKLNEANNHPYNLIVSGDGHASEQLKKEMPKAIFTGNLSHEELGTMYASSDVFVFPSTSETYGNVVVEAMASGLPCVIANGGGSKDFVQHRVNGFLCSPNEASEYLKYADQLMSSDILRMSIRENALSSCKGHSWEELTHQYFEDVQHLASSGHSIRA